MRNRSRVFTTLTALAAAPALAQTPSPAMLPPSLPVQTAPAGAPPVPMPMPPLKEGGTVRPADPIVPLPLTPPTAAPAPACVGCGDNYNNIPDVPTGPDAQRLVPPHKGVPTAAWMNVGIGLQWLKPQPLAFPIAVGAGGGLPTQTLLGETTLGTREHGAIRVDGGTWTNDCHTFGFGFGGMLIEHRSRFQAAETDGSRTIARPFTDALTGRPNSILVGGPGVGSGAVALAATSRLSGLEGNLRRNLHHREHFDLDLFVGARYLDLDESLTVYQTTTVSAAVPVGSRDTANNVVVPSRIAGPGSVVQLVDRAYTRNQFYGGEAGLRMEYRHGIFFGTLTPRVGFGPVHSVTYIDGNTDAQGVLERPTSGGLLAVGLPTAGYIGPDTAGNIGRNVTNRFAALTEIGATLGVQVTQAVRVSVGYNFLYLSSVARPGTQFDTTINPRLVPVSSSFGATSGPNGPRLTFDREDFYAHGATLTVGLQY